MAEHTPKPWFTKDGIVYQKTGDRGILTDPPIKIGSGWREDKWSYDFADDETLANAHLIAAAPDMFEACVIGQKLVEAIPANERLPEQQKALNGFADAIAKASGEVAK